VAVAKVTGIVINVDKKSDNPQPSFQAQSLEKGSTTRRQRAL